MPIMLPPGWVVTPENNTVATNLSMDGVMHSSDGFIPYEEVQAEITATSEPMEIEDLSSEEEHEVYEDFDTSEEDLIIDEDDEDEEEEDEFDGGAARAEEISAIEAFNRRLDELTQEQNRTAAPVYPARLDDHVAYIIGQDDGTYMVTCQGHTERNIYELMRAWETARHFQRAVSPRGYGGRMTIYPQRDTPEWRYMEQGLHEVIPAEEAAERSADMPARTHVADGPHVIRVSWQADRNRYRVYFPYRNCRDFTHTYHNDANSAHMRARECAATLRDHDGNPWKVLPRRNTNEWRDLLEHVNWAEQEDPANAMAEATRHRLFLEGIRQSPASSQTHENIEQCIRKRMWEAEGGEYRDETVDRIRNELAEEIRVATGITFLVPEVEGFHLLHPDNAVTVHYGPSHLEEYGMTTEAAPVSVSYAGSMSRVCGGCNQRFLNQIMQRVSSDTNTYYCAPCYEAAGFYNCALCQRVHRNTPTCERYEQMPSNTIHNYSMDVRRIIPKMYHMPSDKMVNGNYLRYGVELEVIAIEDRTANDYLLQAAGKVGDAMKHHAILKSDSSLRAAGHGFEIVSAPATLEYHKRKMWNKLFGTDERGNNVLPTGVKPPAAYVKSWTTDVCGIHVHITRAALTKMQLGKLCVFYNEPCNNGFLGRIAGRAVNRDANYCRARKKKLHLETPRDCQEHHDAISISTHNKGKTAEVRIFRGNCSRHGLMRCLEFVDATVHWCAENGASQLEFGNFLRWFNQSSVRSRYPDLFKHLYQLGYVQTKHKSKGKNTLDVVPEAARIA